MERSKMKKQESNIEDQKIDTNHTSCYNVYVQTKLYFDL